MTIISPAAIPPSRPASPPGHCALIAERGDGMVAALEDRVTVHPGVLQAVAWLRDQVGPLVSSGAPVTVGVDCRDGTLIAGVFKPLGATVITAAGTGSTVLGDYVEAILGPAPAPVPEPGRTPRMTVAAADASWNPRRPGHGAWAAVRDDGKYVTGWVNATAGKYGPEEQALRAVFRAWGPRLTEPGDQLILLSDSLHAVATMTRWLPNSGADRFIRERTFIRWVKGHAGHPLNEAADRIAVAARRIRPGYVHQGLAAGIAREAAEEFAAGRGHWLGQVGFGAGEAAAA
jgi:ribonuclease HI